MNYRPYVTDIPYLWRNNREGYPRGALWTNGKELYSYGLLIGDTLDGVKRLFAYTRGDGTGEKYKSMTTSQHVGMTRPFADVILVWNGNTWVSEAQYERGEEGDTTLLMVQWLTPDEVLLTRSDVQVKVVIYPKAPHEGYVAIRLPGKPDRSYPIREWEPGK